MSSGENEGAPSAKQRASDIAIKSFTVHGWTRLLAPLHNGWLAREKDFSPDQV